MPVGEHIPRDFLEGRHGVLIEAGKYIVDVQASATKRAARAAYLELHDWLPVDPGRVDARPGDEVVVSRIERNRVVEEWRIRIPGEPGPDAGVREPRGPRPPRDAGAAAVELP